MRTASSARTFCLRAGWVSVGILILILVVFALKRSFDTFSGAPHEGLFELRYLEHPAVTLIHMLSGLLFLVLAPVQFMAKVRTKNLHLHRRLGRVLVACALFSGVYGITSIVALPAFGGLASETAGWFFGALFLFSVIRAFICARNRRILQHREWMIRAFALGLGVGTQRLLLILFLSATGASFEQSFGPALWLGFALNLLVAETWINLTRTHLPSTLKSSEATS